MVMLLLELLDNATVALLIAGLPKSFVCSAKSDQALKREWRAVFTPDSISSDKALISTESLSLRKILRSPLFSIVILSEFMKSD